ncbi:MAG: WbqC family protein, partial [Rhodothermales bacterium]|nr:WbqC family protein [Rhodothermales bacterium]
MRCAVRPPEYLPRLAYCALGFVADRVVLADTLPYSRQSFQNRARIRTPNPGGKRSARAWQWLSVPLRSGAPGRPIHEVPIDAAAGWARRHEKALQFNYGTAPFFHHYAPQVAALWERPWERLADLTAESVEWTLQALGAPAALLRASALPGRPARVPALLRAAGADVLVTLPESAERDRAHAEAAGVRLQVVEVAEQPRRQNFEGFVPGLSALDLLMNYGSESAGLLQ